MPKKTYEPARIFEQLLLETREVDGKFVVKTDDPAPELFAENLINQHYPAQSELPLV